MSETFDERFERLLTELDDLEGLLTAHGERRWAESISRCSTEIRRFQRHGLDSLLSFFGGMGSLNDLIIHPVNGHSVSPDEVSSVNRHLEELRSAIYEDGSALRRELR